MMRQSSEPCIRAATGLCPAVFPNTTIICPDYPLRLGGFEPSTYKSYITATKF